MEAPGLPNLSWDVENRLARAQGLGQDLGYLGFSHPGFALEQQGFFHSQGQKNRGGQAAVADVFQLLECPEELIDRLKRFCLRCGLHFAPDHEGFIPACPIISKNNGTRACVNSGSLMCPSSS